MIEEQGNCERKMGKNKLWLSFIREQRGVILIETAVVLIGLAMVIFMIVDLGIAFVTQSQLERTSHSLSSILRERVALYSGDEIISQENVNQITQLGSTLMANKNIAIRVDALYFKPIIKADNDQPIVKEEVVFYSVGTKKCASSLPSLAKVKHLSPNSSLNRWMPLYRLSICLPGEKSWFKSLVNASNSELEMVIEELVAYNIVLPR